MLSSWIKEKKKAFSTLKVRFSLKISGPEVIKPHSECHPERSRKREHAPHMDGI